MYLSQRYGHDRAALVSSGNESMNLFVLMDCAKFRNRGMFFASKGMMYRMIYFQLFAIVIFGGVSCFSSLWGQSVESFDGMDFMPPKDVEIVDGWLGDAKRLSGGIRFVEKKAGVGEFIQKGDLVTALYIGRLIDGRIFNQKQSRGHMFHFEVGANPREIIEGWEHVMPLMQKGGKYEVAIPSQFAYRSKGRRGQVPPYATVIFEIDIVDVKD